MLEHQLKNIFLDLGLNYNSLSRIGLAVSGGSDSMALLYMVKEWQLKKKYSLCTYVFTVDHSLRVESAFEAMQVKKICEELGFKHETLLWQHGGVVSCIQEKARIARYNLLSKAAKKNQIAHILIAHTLDDMIETFLMRLNHQSGLQGLASLTHTMLHDDIYYHKPLLLVTKKELQTYLTEKKHIWFEDPSNVSDKYERVRIRQFLLHYSDKKMIDSIQNTIRKAQILRLYLVLDAIEFSRGYVQNESLFSFKIVKKNFLTLDKEVQIMLLKYIIQLVSCKNGYIKQYKFDSFLENLKNKSDNFIYTLSHTLIIVKNDNFYILREQRHLPQPIKIQKKIYLYWDNRFEINIKSDIEGLVLQPLLTDDILKYDSLNSVQKKIAVSLPSIYFDNSLLWSPLGRTNKGIELEKSLDIAIKTHKKIEFLPFPDILLVKTLLSC